MRKLWLLLILLCAAVALSQNPVKEPLNAFPGATIQVTTKTDLDPDGSVTLRLVPSSGGLVSTSGVDSVPCKFDAGTIDIQGPAKTSFSFSVPPDAAVGQYKICVQAVAKDKTTRAADVSSPQWINVNPQVTGIDPKAFFLDDKARVLTFLGPPSLKADTANQATPHVQAPDSAYSLKFAGRALPRCGATAAEPPQNGQSCFTVVPAVTNVTQSGQVSFQIKGAQFMNDFKGKQSVALIRNGAESDQQDLYVVNAARTTPRNYAVGITAALVLLIYLLLRAGSRTMQTPSARRSYLLTALFLDEETQSYSLSKCQFYAWTLAAVLGYLYFAVARSVIQGSAVFPDIPAGLPGILLFSAGTSVLATGITSSKGSKGAGAVHPTLADFITNGGVVAPERLQFVVWTVTGIFTFLTIVFNSDPLTLSDLPAIPNGFMQLMGISSAGYIGGKLARKAGPVIKGVMVDPVTGTGAQPTLTLTLTGENLDKDGKIKVDGQPIRDALVTIDGKPDPQTKFCSKLTIEIREAPDFIWDSHTLTLVNSDAQAADVRFPVDPMTIDSVDPLPPAAGTAASTISVKGENFRPPTRYQWFGSSGAGIDTEADVPAANITDTKIKVPRNEKVFAGCTLVLTSEIGFKTKYPKK